jgi:hypothetical protein
MEQFGKNIHRSSFTMSAERWKEAFNRGVAAANAANFDTALEAFTEALTNVEGPERSHVLGVRAFVYYDNMCHYDSYLDAVAALALNPGNLQALNARLMISKESGDFE